MKSNELHNESEIQSLAAFVHGALAGLHALGAVYNLKRKNYSTAAIHIGVGVWDCVATFQHAKKVK